jgi:hypothetical protein
MLAEASWLRFADDDAILPQCFLEVALVRDPSWGTSRHGLLGLDNVVRQRPRGL